jgi:hypothetical protein
MANSRPPFQLSLCTTVSPSPRTPGTLGLKDAGDPNVAARLGDTPGPCGINDYGVPISPEKRLSFHLSPVHLARVWEYDPNLHLIDSRLNSAFLDAAKATLNEAVLIGLFPKVHEAYRSPERADALYQNWIKTGHAKANKAWETCHNYGFAMDVWMYNENARYEDRDSDRKGWAAYYKKFAAIATKNGFLWGEKFQGGDSDHYEYHPKWKHPVKGPFLKRIHEWAIAADAAAHKADPVPNANVKPPAKASPAPKVDGAGASGPRWMTYVWWAAGLGGEAPPGDYLKQHPAPSP